VHTCAHVRARTACFKNHACIRQTMPSISSNGDSIKNTNPSNDRTRAPNAIGIKLIVIREITRDSLDPLFRASRLRNRPVQVRRATSEASRTRATAAALTTPRNPRQRRRDVSSRSAGRQFIRLRAIGASSSFHSPTGRFPNCLVTRLTVRLRKVGREPARNFRGNVTPRDVYGATRASRRACAVR